MLHIADVRDVADTNSANDGPAGRYVDRRYLADRVVDSPNTLSFVTKVTAKLYLLFGPNAKNPLCRRAVDAVYRLAHLHVGQLMPTARHPLILPVVDILRRNQRDVWPYLLV